MFPSQSKKFPANKKEFYPYRNKTVFKIDKAIPEGLSFPKLRFVNAKEVEKLEEYGPSSENDFFYFIPPHSLFYVQRLKITAYCPFNFNEFPFDSHECELSFGLASTGIGHFILLQPNVRNGNASTSITESKTHS